MSELNENPHSDPEFHYGMTESSADRIEDQTYAFDESRDTSVPIEDPNIVTEAPNIDTKNADDRAEPSKFARFKPRITNKHRAAFTAIRNIAVSTFQSISTAAMNYPRAATAIGLSVLILSGILLTRPSKPVPVAEWSSTQPVADAIIEKVAEHSKATPTEEPSIPDKPALKPTDVSVLEARTPDESTNATQSGSNVQKLSDKSLEAMPPPVTEPVVTALVVPNEPSMPSGSVSEKIPADLLASGPTPAQTTGSVPPLAPLVVPPEKLESPLIPQQENSPLSGGIPSDAKTINPAKAEPAALIPSPKDSVFDPIPMPDSFTPTGAADQPKDRYDSTSLTPATDTATQPAKADTTKNASQLFEVGPINTHTASATSKIASSEKPLAAVGLSTATGTEKAANSDGKTSTTPAPQTPHDALGPAAAAVEKKVEPSQAKLESTTSVASGPLTPARAVELPAAPSASIHSLNALKDPTNPAPEPSKSASPKTPAQSAPSPSEQPPDKPSTATIEAATTHDPSAAKLSNARPPISTTETAQPTKSAINALPLPGSAPAVEAAIAPVISAPSKSDGPAPRPDNSDSVIPKATSLPANPLPEPSKDASQSNWLTVPNNDRLLQDSESDLETPVSTTNSRLLPTPDPQAHADKAVELELESTKTSSSSSTSNPDRVTTVGRKSATDSSVEPSASIKKLDYTPHVVERGENFWTISRQYFATGTYWIALWKCNSDRYPEIDKLRVGDVIMIPPIEDLDMTVTDPRLSKRTANRDLSVPAANTEFKTNNSAVTRSSVRTIDRVSQSKNDSHQEAPNQATEFATDADIKPKRDNQDTQYSRLKRELVTDDAINTDDDVQSELKPRTESIRRRKNLTYKVKRYDTVRSIARDILGDSRRFQEILDMNKAVIDDPTHLVVGQLIELPQDRRQRRTSLNEH